VRKILFATVPWLLAMGLAVGGLAVVGLVAGHMRHSQDVAWCRKVTPTTVTVKGAKEPIDPTQLAEARAGCVVQRRAQRGIFGAVWKTGGQETAVCAVDWGRYQQLADTDPTDAAAVLKPFGVAGNLDAGSRSDQQHFLNACVAAKPTS
jgi:hypothetical protein